MSFCSPQMITIYILSHQAFSVTKLSSMFDKKKRRGHDVTDVESIKEPNTADADVAKSASKPKKKSVLKQKSRKILKELSESAVGSTSRKADCIIQ